jgi:hypothetical protein
MTKLDGRRFFRLRGLNFETISKLNNKTEISQLLDKGSEIKEWVENKGQEHNYVIIDDDQSINALPEYIKERWVATNHQLVLTKH